MNSRPVIIYKKEIYHPTEKGKIEERSYGVNSSRNLKSRTVQGLGRRLARAGVISCTNTSITTYSELKNERHRIITGLSPTQWAELSLTIIEEKQRIAQEEKDAQE